MQKSRFMIAMAGVALSASAMAQSPAPAPAPADSARQAQIDATEAPVTGRLNRAEARATAVARPTPEAAAAYQADIDLYRARVAADHAIVAQDEARYTVQQQAYADAMAAWRIQAAACAKGRRAICNAPAPDPTAFY